jgi:hypothetical protein
LTYWQRLDLIYVDIFQLTDLQFHRMIKVVVHHGDVVTGERLTIEG